MSVGQFYREDDAGAAPLIPPSGPIATLGMAHDRGDGAGGECTSPSGREAVISGAVVGCDETVGGDAGTHPAQERRGGGRWFAGDALERGPNLLVYGLFCVFGVSSWLTINAAFIQLPVLAEKLPEGWAIGSYLAVVIQVANVFPLAFMWYTGNPRSACGSRSPPYVPTPGPRRWRKPTPVERAVRAVKGTVYNRAIATILCVGIASTMLTAFLWDSRVWGRSVLFLFLMFVNGGVDCASSVLYWPFAAQFRTPYIAALSVGEGLSGVASSVLGIVQSPGVHNRFTVTTYFVTVAALMALSGLAFALLLILPAAADERRGRAGAAQLVVAPDKPTGCVGGGTGAERGGEACSDGGSGGGAAPACTGSGAAGQHTQVSSLVQNPGHRQRGGSWGSMGRITGRGVGGDNAADASGARDLPLEVTTASPVIPRHVVAPRWEGRDQDAAIGSSERDTSVDAGDVALRVSNGHKAGASGATMQPVVRSRGGVCCGFRASAVTLWLLKDQLDALVILGWASCLENGIIMSVRTYATLPYANGTQVLFWVGSLVTLVDPLAACLPTWPVLRVYRLRLLCLLFTTGGAAIVLLALSSPNPPLKDTSIGGPLVIALFVLSRVLVSYTRAMCVVSVQRALLRSTTAAGGQAGARWAGVFIQGGALVGSVLMFAIVNGTHVFKTDAS